jgi:hypothetical protein
MKKIYPLLFCILILSTTLIANASTLTISLSVNPTFGRFQQTNITGVLNLDGYSLQNGLVALEIKQPNGVPLTVRTVNTGANPSSVTVDIVNVTCSDLSGNPVSDVTRGSLAYFTAYAHNNDNIDRSALIIMTIYDNSNSPIGYAATTITVPNRSNTFATLSVPIPSWAVDGRAAVFAAAYTNLPDAGGTPFCPEKSSTFTIGGLLGSSPPVTPTGNQGNYNLPITIPKNAPLGTYTIQARSSYGGVTAFADKSFNVNQPGDFDGNGRVNSEDVAAFVDQYINYWAGRPFSDIADFDDNNKVDSNDVALFVTAYIVYWSWQ